ncbi:hypothetical protein C8Q74DRAFT_445464 [Fomes fomentarius]|nr:hypothetical protein C8Q74DRAFT_445464 [Fomes fomentarius]
MSEDDRAAKAARAKALLKKRQAKKAAETGGGPPSPRVASPAPRIASPSPTTSGTFSPTSSAHQQVASPLASVPASVSPPTRTPLGVEEKETHESNGLDVFAIGPTANGNDSSWLSGLTRVEASSPPASVPATIASPAPRHAAQPPPPAATSRSGTNSDKERADLRALVRDQNSTIEALEAEKVSLAASLSNLSQVGQRTVASGAGEDHPT